MTSEPDAMPCSLLHIVEQPDPRPYEDPDLKDLVGSLPRFFCSACTPPRPLHPSDAVRCLDRDLPCTTRTITDASVDDGHAVIPNR